MAVAAVRRHIGGSSAYISVNPYAVSEAAAATGLGSAGIAMAAAPAAMVKPSLSQFAVRHYGLHKNRLAEKQHELRKFSGKMAVDERSWQPGFGLVNSKASGARCAVARDLEVLFSADSRGENLADRLGQIIGEVVAAADSRARIQILLKYAGSLPRLPDSDCIPSNRVMGCTTRVWLTAKIDDKGRMNFAADSDSEVTRGFCAILLKAMNGAWPLEVLAVPTDALGGLGMGIEGVASRANTWYNLLITMQKKTRWLLGALEGKSVYEPFPSLLITADDMIPEGDFAKAQAKYLLPDTAKVQLLAELLKQKQVGVVAHFYMDPEVQGVLVAARELWPHIHISDSLVMADRAVKMADAGCKHIAVLGVDFMSENVRAILDRAGHEKVSVYRMSSERIGCSLADAAQSSAYIEFVKAAASSPPSLHVIYINTSLETKAHTHSLVPTITCTSSNVVQTILQAFAQVSDLTVWYGPDSYMGANLAELFLQMAAMTDDEIKAVHPLHDKGTIAALLPRLHYFHDGSCIVHNLFGEEVVARVRHLYPDAFQTAHFEVPGEMFALAMEAKRRGMGVVGSTQNILDFIRVRVQEALGRGFDDHLQFILGTEAGMITAIVESVRRELTAGRVQGAKAKVEVQIIFPVSSDAITTTSSSSSSTEESYQIATMPIVPGVSSGEGCSLSGGCASCPYMKMNTLDALLRVCQLVGTPYDGTLQPQQARTFNDHVAGYAVSELGCEPILHMRYFQAHGRLSDDLLQHVCNQDVPDDLGCWMQ
ncbi:hypothetical protein O6H91_06G008600 [Diphasiastrum complanatum]|uniref:Uncharacterized protein n=1 Tax=Diphasiastrum complanatum TaxID=34168 RepID=A0ACC2DAS0_DIPCM|nr:hypothetical protein O6H91_06G008600 [Diphasiastrum complanatum]